MKKKKLVYATPSRSQYQIIYLVEYVHILNWSKYVFVVVTIYNKLMYNFTPFAVYKVIETLAYRYLGVDCLLYFGRVSQQIDG